MRVYEVSMISGERSILDFRFFDFQNVEFYMRKADPEQIRKNARIFPDFFRTRNSKLGNRARRFETLIALFKS